jgi:hypothetical protein
LPDYSWYNIPKTGKINQIVIQFTKLQQNISNGNKIDEMFIKYICRHFPIARPSKIDPVWDFWSENMPSGNPAENGQDQFDFQ